MGALGREIWRKGEFDLEILRPEFDAAGYDLVLSKGALTRHVQLKAKLIDGRGAHFDISSKLAEKPSGCVICILISDDLSFEGFKWFGSQPGLPLPSLEHFSFAKHTKGDAAGVKADRPALIRVPISRFENVETMDRLLMKLFGGAQ